MHTRIELITPIVTEGARTLEELTPLMRADLTITQTLITTGPASIESEFDAALSVPGIVRKAIDAERSGADAIIIDCMCDPGLHACREAVSIPVVGPAQCAMHVASTLGHKFAFITVLPRLRPIIDNLVATYGLQASYATFRSIDIPVLDLAHDSQALATSLAREATAAIVQDGADAIILGCTGFVGCADLMRRTLRAQGYDEPILDPIPLAVYSADALVKARLCHSKRAYPMPGRKRLKGYDFEEFAG